MSDQNICPNCGNQLIVNEGYITWCDKCYWNINPDVYNLHKKKIFDVAYHNISEVSVENLYNEILQSNSIEFKISAYSIFAYVISALIYAVSIFCIYYAFRFIYISTFIYSYVVSIILFLIGIEIFPKPTKIKETKLERQEYPAIYKLVDMISEKLKSKKIKNICVSYDFNAFFASTGLKRENFIVLGIPYFSILDFNEKVSVIAHEVTHCKNKDTSRHKFVSSALNTLAKWYSNLRAYDDLKIFLPFTWPISLVVKMLIYILGVMIWRDRQRAEYFADYSAAKIAGVDATISSLEKFYYHSVFHSTLERIARLINAQDLFETFRKRINNVPEREILRVKTIEKLETTDLKSSHPPTLYRNQFITNKIKNFEKLGLAQEEIEQIEAEFKKAEKMIERRILNDYREFFVYR